MKTTSGTAAPGFQVSRRVFIENEIRQNDLTLVIHFIELGFDCSKEEYVNNNLEAFSICVSLEKKENVELGKISYLFVCIQR